ncbi:MAG: hypothetical protein R3B13_23375 [Polyangiaceae bacterium]
MACAAGQRQLHEGWLSGAAPAVVPLKEGLHCLRALAVGESSGASITLTLRLTEGREWVDELSGDLAVLPARGPLCVRGPTRVELHLGGAGRAHYSLHEVAQQDASTP